MTDDLGLVNEFVTEATEQLNGIEGRVLEIESQGTDFDRELINTVFRAIHSTKGAAGFLGLESIGILAHSIENVLNLIRNDQLSPSSHSTDVLLNSIDCLKALLADVENSNRVDVSSHRDSLDRLAETVGRESQHGHELGHVPPVPTPARTAAAETTHAAEAATQTATLEASPAAPPAPAATTSAASAASAAAAGGDAQVRVSVKILDQLMTLASEMVLARNQLLQVIERHPHPALEPVAARVDQVTSDMQEVVMQSRMQPVGNIFGKFNRIVRDLSGKLGKKCDLRIEGSDVELDKTIIEAIGDPLTHLVRNSLDHGIELPETRKSRNKPPAGALLLRACHQGGKVKISIVDDGAGIDAEKLKRKAVERGLVTPDQAAGMSRQDAVGLIFHAGFSTAEKVTDVSGRGVGMDVVKTNIVRIGGAVDVDTSLGEGTTINITLPLTLAIIPSLIVRSGGDRFAVPQSNIVELVRVKGGADRSAIETIKASEMLRLRDELLPLVRLNSVLGGDAVAAASSRNEIVVVENGAYRFGLVVDELRDPEEIVVKPLGRHLSDCSCLAGATVLGDGEVALILDLAGIAAHVKLAKHHLGDEQGAAAATTRDDDTQELLLFSNAPSELFAVPMAVVKRIERIEAREIVRVGEQEVRQYEHATLPLLRLERQITALPPADVARPYVIVFGVGDQEVGLIAPNILDIRRTVMDVDTHTFRQPGVVGSLVIDRQTVRLVDVYETAVTAHPEWKMPTVDTPSPAGRVHEVPRILLAEDSQFFRGQVRTFLESQGYEVTDCEDGQAAWETLDSADRPFQLIVTDIEMPRMDGIEFCRTVRADARFKLLPIIAVTSLAGDDDQRRGTEAGITDYQVKMDRDRLVASVRRLTAVKRK